MKKAKKCVYLLEDNDDIREMISFLLTEENYEVHGYPTVKSFNDEMKTGKPDMIVLDVMLADGNGIDVCDSLKSNKRTKQIPILMMSAHAQLLNIKEKCDAEDFISKPFDIYDFVKKVDHYLN
ncbi:response regulator [Pedobacter polaris]|uniref:Response regulator n=1 Tax=Pedobacter polaris TaxID=2571273 RepID=A0A4U1CSX9_9SPHI|nr:response regulator [Pedobacter polaris]TKC10656.1 response regulator [Pedobacter polaris]